eukprot:4862414-Alexandrium_andersonii.AAC.1
MKYRMGSVCESNSWLFGSRGGVERHRERLHDEIARSTEVLAELKTRGEETEETIRDKRMKRDIAAGMPVRQAYNAMRQRLRAE